MKVIITGSTGMLGKGTLLECLDDPRVDSILVVNRRTIGITHPKLREVLHKDFTDVSAIKQNLVGYDACFFCMGVSSAGMKEDDYTRLTYQTTKAFADTLYELNPQLVFNFISGAGTNHSEKGGSMWSRVKGRTENMVLNKGFKDAYCFRPGAIIPKRGVRSRTGWVNAMLIIFWPFFFLFRLSKSVTTTVEIGQAMIAVVESPLETKRLEGAAIRALGSQKH